MKLGGIDTERPVTKVPPAAFTIAVTLVLGATVGIIYWSDRAYRRWCKANHPFAEHAARIERMGTSYRQGRANLGEVGQVIWEIFGEASRAGA
jgi:hypothetical protein